MSAAERQRRYRRRLRAGTIPLTIDVDDVHLPAFLARAGYLDLDTEDRTALREAVESYLGDIASPATWDVTASLRDLLKSAKVQP